MGREEQTVELIAAYSTQEEIVLSGRRRFRFEPARERYY